MGYRGVVENMTSAVEAGRKAHHSEEILRRFMDSTADSIVIFDSGLNIVDANQRTVQTLGISREDLIGQNLADVAPDSKTSGRFERYLEVIRTGVPYRSEFTATRPEGEVFREATAFRVGDGMGFVVRDITAQRNLENQLRSAKREAEFANRAKSEFLANMSHELRTPLNAIIGFSEIMIAETFGPVGSPKYESYVTDIHSSGGLLLDLVTDILDLAKIESGRDELHEVLIEVPRLVKAVIPLVAQRAKEGGIMLETRVPGNLPRLSADERKLKQILVNLLSNGIKFTKPGGVVRLTAFCRDDDGMTFQIEDTGVGIAAEDIPTALRQFGQVENIMVRSHKGTGIGLPLTKALVEQHGGPLKLESEVGVGTTVTVDFPAARTVRWVKGLAAPNDQPSQPVAQQLQVPVRNLCDLPGPDHHRRHGPHERRRERGPQPERPSKP